VKHHRDWFAGGASRRELRRIEWRLRGERGRCQTQEQSREDDVAVRFHNVLSKGLNMKGDRKSRRLITKR
jgi:hypothetical protein